MKAFVAPLLHPASILRGRFNLEAPQQLYLRRTVEWLRAPTTLLDCTEPPTGAVLFPNLFDLERFEGQLAKYDALSIDLENAGEHLICSGLVPLRLESGEMGWPLCLRFRVRGGGRYWTSWGEHVEATKYLYRWLSCKRLTKIFHNGVGYDVPFLETLGFEVNGHVLDTMVMAHWCYSELPKGLQWLSTFWLGAPVWKRLVEESDDTKEA